MSIVVILTNPRGNFPGIIQAMSTPIKWPRRIALRWRLESAIYPRGKRKKARSRCDGG
jgi:hypothetical protein